jgi:hypothetical protein
VKFWTWKFSVSLAFTVGFVLLAYPFWTDPTTGERFPILKNEVTGKGILSFIFLLAFLFVISHAGGYVLARFRGWKKAEPEKKG